MPPRRPPIPLDIEAYGFGVGNDGSGIGIGALVDRPYDAASARPEFGPSTRKRLLSTAPMGEWAKGKQRLMPGYVAPRHREGLAQLVIPEVVKDTFRADFARSPSEASSPHDT
jgi:hypothetical protein